MRFWKRIFPYLILNVIVSAATTLVILAVWDRSQSPGLPLFSNLKPAVNNTQPTQPIGSSTPQPAATLPPLDSPVITIEAVIGAGDVESEMLELKRVGEGELLLTGWKISNGRGDEFTFPELVLNKNGSVRLYTRSGVNSVIELYWGRSDSVWRSGDTASLTDPEGNLRASYALP